MLAESRVIASSFPLSWYRLAESGAVPRVVPELLSWRTNRLDRFRRLHGPKPLFCKDLTA